MTDTINGRKLNTDTSEKIGVCTKNNDYQQVLYRNRAGTYFFHHILNEIEKLEIINYSAAKSWAKENLPNDCYIEFFGPPELGNNEGSERVSLNTNINTKNKLRHISDLEGKQVKKVFREAIEFYTQKNLQIPKKQG